MRSLFRVLTYLAPYRHLAIATLACAVVATVIDLAPPWIIKLVIDTVVRPGNLGPLPWLMGALALAFLGRNVLSGARVRLNNLLEQRVIYDLRREVYGKLQALSVRYYDQRSTGELVSRVTNDTSNLERIFIDGVEALVMAGLTLIGVTVILFTMHWRLALLALIPIPLLIVGATFFTRRVHADIDRVQSGLDHPARDVLGDERAVADHPDFLDALRLGVAHLLDELAVEERLAVVVHAHVRDPERRALVHDLLEEVHVHDALPPVHLVARAEHALGVAEVRAFDLDDVGQPSGLVAAGREQQLPDGLGVGAEQPLGGGSRATGQGHSSDYR